MQATASIYSRLVLAGFRTQSAYLLAAFGGLVANTTFGFLKVAILFATVAAAGGEVAGYDRATMSTYVWLSQGMLGSVNLHGRLDLATRIKDGSVAVDFLRPLDVQAATVATEVGKSLFAVIPRGLPSVAIGALVVGMAMPATPLPYLLGVGSFLLGIVIGVLAVYLVTTAGFWLVETRGLQVLYMVVAGFLSGLYVPISLFPHWLETAATLTPFPSIMMYPIDILSGRVAGAGTLGLLAQQLVWVAVLVVAGQVATAGGRRRLEVQGG